MKKIIIGLILSLSFLTTYADMAFPTTQVHVELNNFDIIFVLSFIICIIFPILFLLRKIRKK